MRKLSEDTDMSRILIGVTGGSAAGKTTLCQNIGKQMAIDGNFKVLIIPLDAFYKSIDKTKIDVKEYDFDHPQALDFNEAYNVLSDLLKGKKATLPRYSFVTHQRLKEVDVIAPTEIIMFEGILALYDARIRALMKYKIFIHCDDDIRLCRRILRDVQERGRTIEGVLLQYNKFVKNAYKEFIYPTIRYADLIVPGSRNNKVSVDFIVRHMKNMTKEIQFYRRAINTKIYFYGEVLETFLKGEENVESNIVQTPDEVEFIFACTDQHKKEIDLYMDQLINEPFSYQYFKDIFTNQFVRILIVFLKKITIALKHKNLSDLGIINYEDIYQLESVKLDESKQIQVLFLPYMTTKNYSQVLKFREKLSKTNHLILLTICCFHQTLKKFTKAKNLTIFNLFCIANEQRFEEVLRSNIKQDDADRDLFDNTKLIGKSNKIISEYITKKPEDDEE